MKYSRGRVLTLVSDCHSSRDWVGQCAKFLDGQGVRRCGHSAREKGILLKVFAACRTCQDAVLLYTSHSTEKGWSSEPLLKNLSDQQRAFGVDLQL